ncbi:AraC family transcriptional regulator [Lacrimispora sp. JR3]|uniref:AraC family transcriptional regulator n=1 Tax=Lacrimispora sinapis TaxID=3111456 RepID=UPI0037482341
MKYGKNHRRSLALLLALFIAAALLFSSFFVFTHLKHDCTGKGCSVCTEIGTCIRTIHLLSDAIGWGAAGILVCICVKNLGKPYAAGLYLCPASLVRLKVRLNH